eukprot:COSAG05_NODE_10794_length_546_cov_1.076063_1_plen_69_part_10
MKLKAKNNVKMPQNREQKGAQHRIGSLTHAFRSHDVDHEVTLAQRPLNRPHLARSALKTDVLDALAWVK